MTMEVAPDPLHPCCRRNGRQRFCLLEGVRSSAKLDFRFPAGYEEYEDDEEGYEYEEQ